MLPRRIEPREGIVREPWTLRLGEQALGRNVESLVQCLLPDAPKAKGLEMGEVGLATGRGRDG
jgi:hypothetical protein